LGGFYAADHGTYAAMAVQKSNSLLAKKKEKKKKKEIETSTITGNLYLRAAM
jgi:hypothetical protein